MITLCKDSATTEKVVTTITKFKSVAIRALSLGSFARSRSLSGNECVQCVVASRKLLVVSSCIKSTLFVDNDEFNGSDYSPVRVHHRCIQHHPIILYAPCHTSLLC